MPYGDYYNPTNKTVNAGDIVYADDLNSINTAVDAGFAQVASDLDALYSAGAVAEAKAWASNAAGTRPDILIDSFSSKAYAAEAKGWATSDNTIVEASTGVALAGSASAKAYATQASASASSAASSSSSASANAILAGSYRDTAVAAKDTAVTKASEASASAVSSLAYKDLSQRWANEAKDVVVADGKYSAYHWSVKASENAAKGAALTAIDDLTPASDKIPYFTGSTTAGLATLTSAGRALLDDVDAAAQRVTLGLGNVANVNSQNADNLTSGTVADARIASTITRNTEVNTATQAALDLKVNIASPNLIGTPTAPTANLNTNTAQIATTAFMCNQASTSLPVMDGIASAGNGYLYSKSDHRHPSDTSKASLVSPQFTGIPLAPTATAGTNTTQLSTTAFVATAVASKAPIISPSFTGTVSATGGFTAINSAIRASGWGGSSGDGVVYFGDGSDYIYKLGSTFRITIDGVGTALINKSGTVAMTSDIPAPGISADFGYNTVGSLLFASSSTDVTTGSTISGSSLSPCGVQDGGVLVESASTPSGTWRCLGYCVGARVATMFQRIA